MAVAVAGHAPVTAQPIGSTPNANGFSLQGQAFTLQPASTAFGGVLAALDKLKLDDIWTDAQAVGILPANSGATNNTNFAAWYATAPNASTLYFAPGQYDFATELPNNRDIRLRYLGAGKGRSIIRTTSATANIINQSVAGFYISVEELGFAASVTKTAGAAILANGNNAYLDVRRCEFTGQFRSIDFLSSAGNVGVINECLMTSPSSTVGGSQIRINGTGINMMIQNCTINNGAVATVGCEINQVGACQITGCDFIGGTNALLLNPSGGQVQASAFVTNSYFDNTLGSCILITGAGAAVRNKFVGCSFTLAAAAAAGSAGLECSTTVAAGSQGLEIIGCSILNTFGAASCNGVKMTGAADFTIQACNVAGWTTGLNLTPHTTAGTTLARIQNNIIGTSGGYGVNTTGILLNAGAVAYGALEIQNNDCVGNTTPLTNSLTTNIPANASRYRITDNAGINPKGNITTPAVPASTVAATNTTGYRATVYVKAGTLTVVTINGVSINQTATAGTAFPIPHLLDPGGTIAITYSVAPTWVWVGN